MSTDDNNSNQDNVRKRRLQFVFSRNLVEKIDDLSSVLSLNNRAAVMRRAVNLLKAITDIEQKHGEITLTTADGREHILVVVD